MKTGIYIFLCICFFSPKKITAQIFPYRQYTSDGELANTNVYDIIQDAEGFLWFATDNGLSRFDGSKSNYYGVEDGLPGNI
ncbi:MAG: hypothetical protein H7Y00_08555, partial [Fimbriimonadaceae bacterium]|nr:hypothetical protein [Chitinophagales bacterium]